MNKNKEEWFIKQLYFLSTDTNYYLYIFKNSGKKVLWFFIKLMLFYAIIVGSYFAIKGYFIYKPFLHRISSEITEIKIENGSLTLIDKDEINVKDKDTNISFHVWPSYTLNEIDSRELLLDKFFAFTQDGILISFGEDNTYKSKYTKDNVLIKGANLDKNINYLIYLLLLFSVIFHFIAGIFDSVIMVIVFSVLNILLLPFTKLFLSKRDVFTLGVYALAPAVFYSIIITMLNLSNPFIAIVIYILFFTIVLNKFKLTKLKFDK